MRNEHRSLQTTIAGTPRTDRVCPTNNLSHIQLTVHFSDFFFFVTPAAPLSVHFAPARIHARATGSPADRILPTTQAGKGGTSRAMLEIAADLLIKAR
jgi:hypothetical protein